MNPQPDPIIGNIGAAIFVMSIIYYTIIAIRSNNIISMSDNFVIGYIESEHPAILTAQQSKFSPKNINFPDPQSRPKLKPKTSPVIKSVSNFKNQQLYTDCIDALVALGMKKREAKEKTTNIFSTVKPNPITIQDFLIIALKK